MELVEKLIGEIERINEENERWVGEQSTISHLHYAIAKSQGVIDDEKKKITIICDNETGFCTNMNNDIEHFELRIIYKGWTIDYQEHHCSGLVCAGYCSVYNIIEKMIKNGAKVQYSKKWREIYNYEKGRYETIEY